MSSIPVLTSTNFQKWKQHVMIVLGCMDLDYALRYDRPAALTSSSTAEQKADFDKWERSNRMRLMIMQNSISETIRGSITEEEDAKKFFSLLADQFTSSEKVETTTILTKLVTMRYKGKGNIREYIMEMSNLVQKLRAFKLDMSDGILIHLVLISLPTQYGPFKISYNTQKDKWTLNELIAQLVQEEERLKQERTESAHLASSSKDKFANKKRKKDKTEVTAAPGASQPPKDQKK